MPERIEYSRKHDLGRFNPNTVWTEEYVLLGNLNRMLVYVEGEAGDEYINVDVVSLDYNRLGYKRIMEIQLSRKKNSYIVDISRIDSKFQGFGIAPQVYRYLLRKLSIVLQAGEVQSPGGRSIWARMADMSGINLMALDGRKNHYDVEADDGELIADGVKLYDGPKRMRLFAYANM